jgi:hypothetical protein
MKRRRLGPERGAIVEAHTRPPPPLDAKKQRAIDAREAATRRAEQQNQFVADVLATPTGHTCRHGNTPYYCKECPGAGICRHQKVRYGCRECGGKGYCQHNKWRRDCSTCTPAAAWRQGWWLLERPGREADQYMFREYQRQMREEEAHKPIRLGPRTKRILPPKISQ